jgi:hypothetical protein
MTVMAKVNLREPRQAVVAGVIAVIGALLLSWVVWSVVVAFSGGSLPILGWHTKPSASHALIVLFGLGGLATGVFVVTISGGWVVDALPAKAD